MDLLTVPLIAEFVEAPQHRVRDAIRRLDIQPEYRVGVTRMFDPGAADIVRAELERVDNRRRDHGNV